MQRTLFHITQMDSSFLWAPSHKDFADGSFDN